MQSDGRFPVKDGFGFGNIRLALFGIVGGERFKDELGIGVGKLDDRFGELFDGEFTGVAEVDGAGNIVGGVHHLDKPGNQIGNVAETAGLGTVAVNGDIFIAQRLQDEVADHAAVIGMHPGAVGVEDADDLGAEIALHTVAVEKSFGTAFAFIVAGADADGVDVAPVLFNLRMNERVAVDFAGGSLKDLGIEPLRQTEHIDRAVNTGLHGLDGVFLIMDGACRTGEVVNFVTFDVQGKGHIVADELKTGIVQKAVNIALGTGEEIVNADDFIALRKQCFAQVRTEKSAAAGN